MSWPVRKGLGHAYCSAVAICCRWIGRFRRQRRPAPVRICSAVRMKRSSIRWRGRTEAAASDSRWIPKCCGPATDDSSGQTHRPTLPDNSGIHSILPDRNSVKWKWNINKAELRNCGIAGKFTQVWSTVVSVMDRTSIPGGWEDSKTGVNELRWLRESTSGRRWKRRMGGSDELTVVSDCVSLVSSVFCGCGGCARTRMMTSHLMGSNIRV